MERYPGILRSAFVIRVGKFRGVLREVAHNAVRMKAILCSPIDEHLPNDVSAISPCTSFLNPVSQFPTLKNPVYPRSAVHSLPMPALYFWKVCRYSRIPGR